MEVETAQRREAERRDDLRVAEEKAERVAEEQQQSLSRL